MFESVWLNQFYSESSGHTRNDKTVHFRPLFASSRPRPQPSAEILVQHVTYYLTFINILFRLFRDQF